MCMLILDRLTSLLRAAIHYINGARESETTKEDVLAKEDLKFVRV